MSTVQEYPLFIDRGTTFTTEFTIKNQDGIPVDLSSATFASQVRKSYTSTTAYPFTVTLATDGRDGQVVISMTATMTGSMQPGRYVYDAQYQIGDVVVRFLRGIVTINPNVTQV